MSSISRSRRSAYLLYNDLLNNPSSDPVEAARRVPRRGPKPATGNATARGASKASLLDLLLDETGKKRPATRTKPVKAQPRRPGDKDEFRLRENGTKGMPVRLSSADTAEEPRRSQPGRGGRASIANWFSDGFDDADDKRTT